MKKLVALTGAGISAESGLKTFRDSNGLWEGHDVMTVASIDGWLKNPEKVLTFYNDRRRQLKRVAPNEAHKAFAELSHAFDVSIITQNVDNLHERADTNNTHQILHLHGELTRARSELNPDYSIYWEDDIVMGDKAPDGAQLRPDIVWFGEAVPMMEQAIAMTQSADIFVIVGTSLQVYPAADLVHYCAPETPIYYIDPQANDALLAALPNPVHCYSLSATKGMVKLLDTLLAS